jgi:glycosyltransferase involved in cell wall biosynthesis
VLLQRYFRRHEAGFDLAVSTANEFALGIPSLQYVHFPQFNLHRTTEGDPGRLNGLWSRLAAPQTGKDSTGNPPASFQQTTVLTNSQWTGEVFEAIYGVQPTVLHPPVDPIECPQPWADRESGIVAIGRIAPDKRLLDAIEVVDRLRERGYDLHLHIAGSAPPAYRSYVSQVASAATERSHVHFERDVPRDRIRDLLCGHRFGLNLKEREHFGMAVAEYVAAGMLPFAPDGGGQREILQDRPAGLFDSVPDAVDRVAGAIDREDRPDLQRDRFASERFQATIRQQVSQTID